MLSDLTVLPSGSGFDLSNSNYNYDNTNTNVGSHLSFFNYCINPANMAKNKEFNRALVTNPGEDDLLKAKA